MNHRIILVIIFILGLTSCSSDDKVENEPCVDVNYNIEAVGIYGCHLLYTNLDPDTYAILRSQDQLYALIPDACIIPFYQRDVFVGKKQLQKQFDYLKYDLKKDCETNNYKLIVTFKTGTYVISETVSYSGVIPKLQPGQSITVETIVL